MTILISLLIILITPLNYFFARSSIKELYKDVLYWKWNKTVAIIYLIPPIAIVVTLVILIVGFTALAISSAFDKDSGSYF